jgi:hypothetical protein
MVRDGFCPRPSYRHRRRAGFSTAHDFRNRILRMARLRRLATLGSDDCGEAPQSAREACALPGKCRRLVQLVSAFWVATFAACETANYVPPVTLEMTAASHGKRGAEVSTLERGRNLFVHRCIECHTLPPIWKYSNEDWPKIVDDMSHRANLKPQDRDAVIAYTLAARADAR